MHYFYFIAKQFNTEYKTFVGYTQYQTIHQANQILLSNINHSYVQSILHSDKITKQRYHDMSNTYIIRDMGNMDFVHIDNISHDDEFIDRTIEKLLDIHHKIFRHYSIFNHQIYRKNHSEKTNVIQHIFNASLTSYPMHNPTMCYYLKVYIEKRIFFNFITNKSHFKITKFMIKTQRDDCAVETPQQLCGFCHFLFINIAFIDSKTNKIINKLLSYRSYCSGNSCDGLVLLDQNTCEYFQYDCSDNMKNSIKIYYSDRDIDNDSDFEEDFQEELELLFTDENRNLSCIFQLTHVQNS